MKSFGNNEMPASLPQPQSQYYHPQQQYYQQQVASSDQKQMPPTLAQQYANQPQQQQQMPPFSLPNSYAQSSASNNNNNNNNIPPMPDVAPMMNMYNTLLNNSMVGGLNGMNGLVGAGGEKNRQAVDFTKFANEPKDVLNTLITAEMKEHWSQIEKFNLLDLERLDQMYTYHDALLEDKKFLYTYLCSEYRQKYSKLFEIYDSLEAYVAYVALVLFYGSESLLKQACDGNTSFVQPPRVGESAFKLRMFNRKRKTSGTPTIVPEAKPVDVEEEEAVKRARMMQVPTTTNTVADDHPFFKESLYMSHMHLFKLGEMVKYCIPSEFAIMFCNATLATVNVFTQGDNKLPYKGVRVAFSKPVVSLIRSRSFKAYNYQSLELYGLLREFITTITGKSTDQEPFRLSSLKDMKMKDLSTQHLVTPINWDCSAGFNLALIRNFTCTDTVVGILSNRAYSTPIYHIPKSFVDVSDSDLDDMSNKASNHKSYEHHANLLNDYYDRVEGLVDAETRTATTSQN